MATPFTMKLAGIAQDLHDRFHLMTENDPPLANQIEKFWTGIGLDFPGVDTAWSEIIEKKFFTQKDWNTADEGVSTPGKSKPMPVQNFSICLASGGSFSVIR